MISLDTETHLIATGRKAPPLVCVSFSDGTRAEVVHRSDPALPGLVRQALRFGVVGHNIAFDTAVLAANGFPLEEIFDAYANDRITCTIVREKLLDIATGELATWRKPKGPGYALDVIAKRRLGLTLDKDEAIRLRYETLHDVPVAQWPEVFRVYAETDALVTYRLWSGQASLPGSGNLADEYRQARGAFWLGLMSTWGVLVDQDALDALRRRYEADFAAAGDDLVKAGLARVTRKGLVRNVKAAGARIVQAYANQGLDYPRTEGGGPSLEREACENADDPALARYSEYMQLSTKVSKEIPALAKPLIHAYFDSLVETGRTSCAYPNLQNLPRKGGFRECLIPRPGHVFVTADYGGFELATLAQVCLELLGRSTLADALNAGKDPHCMVAAAILGCPYEEAFAHKSEKSGRFFDARQTGKVANFGFPGGLGYARLVHFAWQTYQVRLTEDAARELKALWFSQWPEMRDYFARINDAVDHHGAIEQLYSGRLRGQVGFTDACNGMFQGLAADIAKDAGFALARECYVGSCLGRRIVLFVHDEFVVEVPDGPAVDQDAYVIERILVDAARPWLPGVKLGVEVTVSRRYKGEYVASH